MLHREKYLFGPGYWTRLGHTKIHMQVVNGSNKFPILTQSQISNLIGQHHIIHNRFKHSTENRITEKGVSRLVVKTSDIKFLINMHTIYP